MRNSQPRLLLGLILRCHGQPSARPPRRRRRGRESRPERHFHSIARARPRRSSSHQAMELILPLTKGGPAVSITSLSPPDRQSDPADSRPARASMARS